MKCPHCNYEDHGHLGDDGKWVEPEKKYGDHFSVKTVEQAIQTSESEIYIRPDITAKRGYGFEEENQDVYACASCGILFINTTH